jgi:hypothetical protein
MRLLAGLILLLFSANSFSAAYFGGNYGYDFYSSKVLEKYKVAPKGPTYGAFLGFGREFVGLEFFYQAFASEGKIKHDGGDYKIQENATALGAALRFSFEVLYLRMGLARYTLDQKVDVDDATARQTAEAVYEIEEKNAKRNGVIFGAGLHTKLGPGRIFLDFTRYQIYSIGHYDTISVGMSFAIPERWFNLGKY